MDVQKLQIKTFMTNAKHYVIPCYQRAYAWNDKECKALYDDIVILCNQRQNDMSVTHFIGSIVCQKLDDSPDNKFFIIDGQQRLITMYLFYLALSRVANSLANDKSANDNIKYKRFVNAIEHDILLENDDSFTDDSPVNHRFDLSKQDQPAMDKLFAENNILAYKDSRLVKNYNFFCKKLAEVEPSYIIDLYKATNGLIFVKIELEANDDAQLIFESLNSKGLNLSEGDKIRNFVLMGFNQCDVNKYYENRWLPIEQNCKDDKKSKEGESLSSFILYYLTINCNRSKGPNKGSLYLLFKDLISAKSNGYISNKVKINELDNLLTYSELYKRINSCEYPLYEYCDTELKQQERSDLQFNIEQCLKGLAALNYSVHTPFTMECMRLHQLQKISGSELLSVLRLEETFLLRRMVCGIESHGLNRLFQDLASSIHQKLPSEGLLNKLELIMCSSSGGVNAMPNDEQFELHLHDDDFYLKTRNSGAIKYILERFVNFSDNDKPNRELIAITKDYSIEHIMPQTLSQEWEASLGVNAKAIQSTWVNRLANLTLLPQQFNSENSNNSFKIKCTHEHGFANNRSPLNQEIAAIGKCEHWGPEEMETRAKSLIEKALKLWPYPKYVPSEVPSDLPKPSIDVSASANMFDYCLADEPRDFSRTRLAGCEFLGQHYDVKKWAPLQRMLLTQLYQHNPERLRSWLTEKWGNFNVLAQFITSEPNFTVAQNTPSAIFKLDEGMYLNSNQDVMDKVKLLKQLFELMEVDPKDLTLHLVKIRNMD